MNDERPIEKLLRRYAKKRRDDAGTPELHPATRRLLQGEVARQFPKGKAGVGGDVSFGKILRDWLPWLGWATAAVVVVGVAAVMFFGGQKTEIQLASAPTESPPAPAKPAMKDVAASFKQDPADLRTESAAIPQPASSPAMEAGRGALAPAPVVADQVARSRADLGMLKKNTPTLAEADRQNLPAKIPEVPRADSSRDKMFAASESIAVTDQAKVENFALEKNEARLAGGGKPVASGSAGAPPASRAQPPTRAAATSDGYYTQPRPPALGVEYARKKGDFADRSSTEAETVQRYVNNAKASLVLTNFQVEQAGNQVRVIDSDGSVYSGTLVVAVGGTEEAKQKTAARAVAAPATATIQQTAQAQHYFYRVAGTNRTLKQQVVFTWNFVGPTNQADALKTQAMSGALKVVPADADTFQNAPINGRFRLGDGKELELNATPTK